jgi:guanine deaminase
MKIYRSALLRFADDGQAVYDSDALLAIAPDAAGVQRVVAAGSWQALADQYLEREGVQVIHLPGKLLAPGFVDLHIHYPQTDVIGAPAPACCPGWRTTPSRTSRVSTIANMPMAWPISS